MAEHEVDAMYTNSGDPTIGYIPWIGCSCGWDTGRSADSWETAGAQYDDHLAEAPSDG